MPSSVDICWRSIALNRLSSHVLSKVRVHPPSTAPRLRSAELIDELRLYSDYILSTTTARIFLANFCFSLMTTPLTNVVYVPSLTNGPAPASAKPSTLRQTDVSSTTVFADVIQVQWQSTDQQIIALMRQTASSSGSRSSTSSSTSVLPGLSTTSPSAAAVSTTADAAATAAPSSGLATGAKVGIGVGVPLGVIALAGLAALVFLFRRRRKPSKPVEDEPAQDVKDPNLAAPAYQELPLHERQPPAEMDASSTAEVPGSTVAAELPPHDHGHDSSPPGNPGGYLSPEKLTPQGSPGFQRMSTEKYARRPSQG